MTRTIDMSDLDSLLAAVGTAGAITVAVMVSSVDGRATVNGRVGDLTGDADQKVLLGVRELAAAVVVGATTIRAEGYDQLLDDAARSRRKQRGQAAEPELVPVAKAGPGVTAIWKELRAKYPDGLLVCEGGPTVLGLVVAAGLLDQLLLSVSPKLVGGDQEKRVIEHAQQLGVELELLQVASAGSSLFLRYGLK
jgi:riboflavin biosynthesis pyrimidine reductase